jgi:hypothetical protein
VCIRPCNGPELSYKIHALACFFCAFVFAMIADRFEEHALPRDKCENIVSGYHFIIMCWVQVTSESENEAGIEQFRLDNIKDRPPILDADALHDAYEDIAWEEPSDWTQTQVQLFALLLQSSLSNCLASLSNWL